MLCSNFSSNLFRGSGDLKVKNIKCLQTDGLADRCGRTDRRMEDLKPSVAKKRFTVIFSLYMWVFFSYLKALTEDTCIYNSSAILRYKKNICLPIN